MSMQALQARRMQTARSLYARADFQIVEVFTAALAGASQRRYAHRDISADEAVWFALDAVRAMQAMATLEPAAEGEGE